MPNNKNSDYISNQNYDQDYILSKSDYHVNIIKKELSPYKNIKIPNQNYSISNDELVEWIKEELTPQEINEIIVMIRNAKSRSSSVKPLFQIIATGLVNK